MPLNLTSHELDFGIYHNWIRFRPQISSKKKSCILGRRWMVGLSLDDIRKLRGERKELVEEVS